jgi:hypothetical protein
MIWLLRALLAATILASTLFSVSAPGLDEQLWLGWRTLANHAIATTLGSQAFAAPDAGTAALGWLTNVLEALFERAGGTAALALSSACALVGALALVELRARRNASEFFAFAASAFAAATFLSNLRSGSGAFGWLVAAAFVLAVTSRRPLGAVCAVLLAVLWCNLSSVGFFAPWLALCVALGRTLDESASAPETRWAWLAVAGCAIALFLTPGGTAFVTLAPLAFHVAGTPAPASVAPLAYRIGFSACLLVATFFGLRGCAKGDILATLAMLIVALLDGRILPLFGIVAAPVLAQAAMRALRSVPVRIESGLSLAFVAVVAFGGWSAARASASDTVPRDVLAALSSDGRAHRVLCTRLEWCGSALAAGDSHLTVFMDQREAAYPQKVREDQHSIASAAGNWRSKVRGFDIDAIVVDRHVSLAGLLELGDGWARRGEQGDARLYVRTGAAR